MATDGTHVGLESGDAGLSFADRRSLHVRSAERNWDYRGATALARHSFIATCDRLEIGAVLPDNGKDAQTAVEAFPA